MANYTGQTYVPQQPRRYDDNLNLAMTVGQMKQGKYDSNKAMLQTYYDALGQTALLRNEDEEYFAIKMREIEGDVENSGRLDLSRAYNVDPIVSKIKGVAKDPFILSAIQQTRKYQNFQQEVAEISKKNPEKFNQGNVQYALDNADFEKYMKGEKHELGNLSYIPYHNAEKELADAAKEFAKQHDDEQYLGKEGIEGSQYHYVDVYGKKVRKDKLEQYLSTVLSPQAKQQLYIDGHNQFRKMTDEQVSSSLMGNFTERIKEAKEQIAEEKAKRILGTSQFTEEQLAKYETDIKTEEDKLKDRNFTRNDAINYYSEQKIKSIADSFSKDIITKRDVNNAIFNEVKYFSDYDQKERELALKQKANEIAQDANRIASLPYMAEKPQLPDEEEDKTKDTIDAWATRKKEFETYLEERMEGFSDLSRFEKDTVLGQFLSGEKQNIIEGQTDFKLDKTGINILTEYRTAYNARKNTTDKVIKSSSSTAKIAYDSMIDGTDDLNLNNVAKFAPKTAELLSTKKSYKDLSPAEKVQVDYELTDRFIKEYDLSDSDRRVFQTAQSTRENYFKSKGIEYKKSDGKEEGGFWSNLGSMAVSGAKVLPQVFSGLTDLGKELKDDIFYGKRVSIENQKKREQEREQDRIKSGQSLTNTLKSVGGLFREDTRLQDIGARDVKEGEGVDALYRTYQNVVKDEITKAVSEGYETLKFNKGYTYNPTTKTHKPYTDMLKNAISSAEGARPLSDTPITVSELPDGRIDIRYLTKVKGGEEYTSTIIEKDAIPEVIKDQVDIQKKTWEKSLYNPNLPKTIVGITPTPTAAEREQRAERFSDVTGIPIEQSRVVLATNTEIKEQLQSILGKDVIQKHKTLIDEYLNQEFVYKPIIKNGILYYSVNYNRITTADGDPKLEKDTKIVPTELKEYDEAALMSYYYQDKLKIRIAQELQQLR